MFNKCKSCKYFIFGNRKYTFCKMFGYHPIIRNWFGKREKCSSFSIDK